MLTIDGSAGEGGGQILRTSLSLSLLTGRPFCIRNIRAGRARPGLLRQHLTCVQAAAAVSTAELEGASLGSQRLVFRPNAVRGGDHTFRIGSAGSTTLILQTVLPALVLADTPSTLAIEGGTHNPFAPTFDYLEQVFLPLLARMGPKVQAKLIRPGFYPAGGGRFEAEIQPVPALAPLHLHDRGAPVRVDATAVVSALPKRVGVRELAALRDRLDLEREATRLHVVSDPRGPGNVVWIRAASEPITEVFVAFGEKGRPAADVARRSAEAFIAWRDLGAPVGPYLADQLLLPLALAGSGGFTTGPLTLHARTNIETIGQFLDVEFQVQTDAGRVRVTLS
jgi:RNA 3'-terminal phosphate cyclase (ATP)